MYQHDFVHLEGKYFQWKIVWMVQEDLHSKELCSETIKILDLGLRFLKKIF